MYDDFSSDTLANYTEAGGKTWTISGGVLSTSGANTSLRRADLATIKCGTVRNKMSSWGGYPGMVGVGGSGEDSGINIPNGYYANSQGSTTASRLKRCVGGTLVDLALESTSARSTNTYYLWRVYISGGTIYYRHGSTALDQALGNAADANFAAGHIFVYNYDTSTMTVDWLDGRPSHLITCSGMTEGHYLRVSDGTTAAEAAASGAGTASVDAGAVLFPLASVQIRTAAAGGGDLIAELDTGDYADMGGGDAFEYSGAAAGNPYWYYQMLARRR